MNQHLISSEYISKALKSRRDTHTKLSFKYMDYGPSPVEKVFEFHGIYTAAEIRDLADDGLHEELLSWFNKPPLSELDGMHPICYGVEYFRRELNQLPISVRATIG